MAQYIARRRMSSQDEDANASPNAPETARLAEPEPAGELRGVAAITLNHRPPGPAAAGGLMRGSEPE